MGFEVLTPREADEQLGVIMEKWYAKGVRRVEDIPEPADRDRAAILMSLLAKRRVGF